MNRDGAIDHLLTSRCRPAILLGDRDAEDPDLGHLLQEQVGDDTPFRIDLPGQGRNLPFTEVPECLPEQPLLLTESEFHSPPPWKIF